MAVKVKEKNGKWWLFVDWHGQRKARCIGSKEAAEKARIMLEARLVLGQAVFEPLKKPEPPAPPLLFGDYFANWIETYAKQACKESTRRSYEGAFRLYLGPTFGGSRL